MMECCEKCSNCMSWTVFIVGFLFLLRDWGVWDFFNIEWYTAVFLLVGICMLGANTCKECKIENKKSRSKKK